MQLRIAIAAPVAAVWAHLSDLASHPRWMSDAVSVEFLSDQRRGPGTTVGVKTRIGPLRAMDLITVTDWAENSHITAHHHGSVTGTARFEVVEEADSTTSVVWVEDLRFPWWMGGRAGLWAARPILRRIWAGNLRRLKRLVEASA